MKKLALVALVSMIGALAQATPKVGDSAIFDLTYKSGGQSYKGSYELNLLSFNAATKEYQQSTKITLAGQVQNQTSTVKESDLLSDSVIEQAVTQCASAGGQAQKITVPAGTFDTCAIPTKTDNGKAMVWVGRVPFGIVQYYEQGNSGDPTQTLQLSSFKAGN